MFSLSRFLFLCSLPLTLLAEIYYTDESPIVPTYEETPSYETDDAVAWVGPSDFDYPVPNFFTLRVDYENIFPGHLKMQVVGNDDAVGLSELNVVASYTKTFCGKEGIAFGVGYTRAHLDWAPNLFFAQQEYNNLDLSISGMTDRFGNLEIKGAVSASLDLSNWDPGGSTFYTITGWGRYAYGCWCGEPIGWNLGATARTGLKHDLLYPIVGIDFYATPRVKVNFIFPVDMVIGYKINDCWTAELAGKIWNTRRRVGPNEPFAKGYWEYRNSGIELGVRYQYFPIAEAGVHVGSTLGNGELRVSNSSDQAVSEFDLHSSMYVGGEAQIRF